jgi:hypothetical protein
LEAKFPLNETDGGRSRNDCQPNADKTYHQANSTRKARHVVMPAVIQ